MGNKRTEIIIKVVVTLSFILMVTMNALANILPINGQTTGEISDKYANLFAPAGYTFSIWGLIYLLLAGYILFQMGAFQKDKENQPLLNKVGVYFSISSIANAVWILCWHYEKIGLSLLLMLIILLCLIKITELIFKAQLSTREKLLVRLPFSVYFGWITIATIANVTTYLVSMDWNGFGINVQVWMIFILLVGVVIGSITMLKYRGFSYGLVIVWAYVGILVKHLSETGFNKQYPSVIFMVASCIFFLVIELFYLVIAILSERETD